MGTRSRILALTLTITFVVASVLTVGRLVQRPSVAHAAVGHPNRTGSVAHHVVQHPFVALAGDPAVLILDSTVTGGSSSLEAQAAADDGFTVTIVDGPTWDSMTRAQFKSYQAIILGDPSCAGDPSPVQPAVQNANVWGPAITGNAVLIGTDPVFHNMVGFISAGINYATSVSGHTGAYIDLSCYYYTAASGTPVPLLDGFKKGGFTVEGQGGCPNNVHIVYAPTAFSFLTDSYLSNWGCSIHEMFDTYAGGFHVMAINQDIPRAYLLVRNHTIGYGSSNFPDLLLPFQYPEQWAFTGGPHGWIPPSSSTSCGTCSGLDWAPPSSETNPVVVAAGAGKVISIGTLPDCTSPVVVIQHDAVWQTWYLHMASISVIPNQPVQQGTPLGVAGTNGCKSDMVPLHIHIELVKLVSGVQTHWSWNNHLLNGWTIHANCTGYTGSGTCTNNPLNYNGYISQAGVQVLPSDGSPGSPPQTFIYSANCDSRDGVCNG
jgi:murein DD-endopeptidase MepM/ murein hydrolase activator NlpD